MAGTVNGEAIDVEDAISVALRFAGGAIATVHYAYALPRPGYDGYVALRGSGGSVKLTPEGRLTWLGPGSTEDPLVAPGDDLHDGQGPGLRRRRPRHHRRPACAQSPKTATPWRRAKTSSAPCA